MALIKYDERAAQVMEPFAHDDKFSFEDLPPQILGGLRDYLARNLRVIIQPYYGEIRVAIELEGVIITQDSFSEG